MFMGLFYLFSKHVWQMANLCFPHKWLSHLLQHVFTFSKVPIAFFVTWIVLFILAYSTYSCFIMTWRRGIDHSSLISAYPDGFLKMTRETPIVVWLLMWGFISDVINCQPNSKLFVLVSLAFIAYIAWLLTLLISRIEANATSVHFLVLRLQVREATRWSGMSIPPLVKLYILCVYDFFFLSLVTYSRVPNNRKGWNNRGVRNCINY